MEILGQISIQKVIISVDKIFFPSNLEKSNCSYFFKSRDFIENIKLKQNVTQGPNFDYNYILSEQISRKSLFDMKKKSQLVELLNKSEGPIPKTNRFKRNSLKNGQNSTTMLSQRSKYNTSVKINYEDTFNLNIEALKKSKQSFLPSQRSEYSKDSSDYYKYWRKKATQYQQQNHGLHEKNSKLLQQKQILEHKLRRLEKKYCSVQEVKVERKVEVPRIEDIYQTKIEEYKKEISDQKEIIEKKQRKIKQLSKYMLENQKLKSLLNNFNSRLSQSQMYKQKSARTQSSSSFGFQKR